MMLDIPQERGMSHADIYYPNEDRECQFPLFNFLEPFRAEYMVVTYFIMFLGRHLSLILSKTLVFRFSRRCHWHHLRSILSYLDYLLHNYLLVRLLS